MSELSTKGLLHLVPIVVDDLERQPKLHRAAQQSFVIPKAPQKTHQRPPTENVERVEL
ncbi:MAG: hypothetical protein R3B91_11070 [Planctomycetaceae bacterium]